jgi:hypothetical protein
VENGMKVFLKNLRTELPYGPATPLLGISKEIEISLLKVFFKTKSFVQ